MVSLLLDSQLAVWWQSGDRRLSPQARDLVSGADGDVLVSRATLWELTIKASSGKLRMDVTMFASRVDEMGFSWLSITNEHILRVADLTRHRDHKDPFDHMLVAQALSESLTLLTADRKLERYGDFVRVV